MKNSNKHVVSEYLNSLLMDYLELPGIEQGAQVNGQAVCLDTVEVTQRLVPCLDPFAMMGMSKPKSYEQLFLVFLLLLNLCNALPHSRLKQYCFRQCQILLSHLNAVIRV